MPDRKAKKSKSKKIEPEELSGKRLSVRLLEALVSENRLEPNPLLASNSQRHIFDKKGIANLMLAITFRAIFHELRANANTKQLRKLRQDLEQFKSHNGDIRIQQIQLMEQRLISIKHRNRLEKAHEDLGKHGIETSNQLEREPLEKRLRDAFTFFNQNIARRWHKAFVQLLDEALQPIIVDYMSSAELENLLPFRLVVDITRLRGRPRESKAIVEKAIESAFHNVIKMRLKPTQSNVAAFLAKEMEASELRRILRRHGLKWADVLKKYSQ